MSDARTFRDTVRVVYQHWKDTTHRVSIDVQSDARAGRLIPQTVDTQVALLSTEEIPELCQEILVDGHTGVLDIRESRRGIDLLWKGGVVGELRAVPVLDNGREDIGVSRDLVDPTERFVRTPKSRGGTRRQLTTPSVSKTSYQQEVMIPDSD